LRQHGLDPDPGSVSIEKFVDPTVCQGFRESFFDVLQQLAFPHRLLGLCPVQNPFDDCIFIFFCAGKGSPRKFRSQFSIFLLFIPFASDFSHVSGCDIEDFGESLVVQ
jgi:hypothetical protein